MLRFTRMWRRIEDWQRHRRRRRQRSWDHARLGREGEKLAERYLKRRGIVVVARGHRDELGEVDLIGVWKRRLVVFVEVKTRRSQRRGKPCEAVHAKKQRRIIRAAERFVSRRHLEGYPTRFDVVSVVWPRDGRPPQVEHIPAAFGELEED